MRVSASFKKHKILFRYPVLLHLLLILLLGNLVFGQGDQVGAKKVQVVNQRGQLLPRKNLVLTENTKKRGPSQLVWTDSNSRIQLSKPDEGRIESIRICATEAPLGYDRKQFEVELKIPFVGDPPTATIYEILTTGFQGVLVDEEGMSVAHRSGWFCQQLQMPHHFTTNEGGEFVIQGDVGKGFLFLEKPYAVCPINLRKNVYVQASLKDNLLLERKEDAEKNLPWRDVSLARRKEIALQLLETVKAVAVKDYASLAKRYGVEPFGSLDASYSILEEIVDDEERSQVAWLLSSWWNPQEEPLIKKFEAYCPSDNTAAKLLLNLAYYHPDLDLKKRLLNDAWKRVEQAPDEGWIAVLISLHFFWLDDFEKFPKARDIYFKNANHIPIDGSEQFLIQVLEDSRRSPDELLKEVNDPHHPNFWVNQRSRGATMLALLLADPVKFREEMDKPEFREVTFKDFLSTDWSRRQVLRSMIQADPQHTWRMYVDNRDGPTIGMFKMPLDTTRSEFLNLNFHTAEIVQEIFDEQQRILDGFARGTWGGLTDLSTLSNLSNRFPEYQLEADWLIGFHAFKPVHIGFPGNEGDAIAYQMYSLRHLFNHQPLLAHALDLHPEYLLEKRLAQEATYDGLYVSQPLAQEVAVYYPEALPRLFNYRPASTRLGGLPDRQSALVSATFYQLLSSKNGR